MEEHGFTSLSEGITLQRHYKEIILDHVRLFKGTVGPDYLFMDDIACPPRNTEASNALESEDINRMQWFVYFLDLNPIEYA